MADNSVSVLINKRERVPRNTNDMNLWSVHLTADDVNYEDPDDEEPAGVAASDQEASPKLYNDAARDERWVQSIKDEVAALRNRSV